LIEGRIRELTSLKPKSEKEGLPHFLDIRVFEHHSQLTEITHNLKPMELIEKSSKECPINRKPIKSPIEMLNLLVDMCIGIYTPLLCIINNHYLK